eukprot:gb/GECG01015166.1/.p1 GENE.gb/GECG01015166.1/~~gb/GECG01015166.1/.p1  ORF type:complete len:307 (+),score=29.87 gb/GECG01015166.1/:1-921(+)
MAGRQPHPSAADQLLLQLASQHNGIQPLLQTFFGFLSRYTDVYVVDSSPQRTMGFDHGVAEKLVLDNFRSFPLKTPDGKTMPHPPLKDTLAAFSTASASHRTTKSSGKESGEPRVCGSKEGPAKQNSKGSEVINRPTCSPTAGVQYSADAATEEEPQRETHPVRYTAENKQIPVGNGGVGPTYVWTQTLHETTITIPFPSPTRGKELDVDIGSDRLRVGRKNSEPKVQGTLGGKVNKHHSLWTIENGTVIVELEKVEHTWWRSAIEGHPEIDTTQVDSTRSIAEYDDETQAAISKLMHEQHVGAQH